MTERACDRLHQPGWAKCLFSVGLGIILPPFPVEETESPERLSGGQAGVVTVTGTWSPRKGGKFTSHLPEARWSRGVLALAQGDAVATRAPAFLLTHSVVN